MSEKRFEFYSDEDLIGVLDTVTGKTFNSFEIVDCLNQQQADLVYLARFIGEFKVEEFRLKLRDLRILEDKVEEQQATITKLQKKLKQKEEEEKLYAKEILRLNELNKQTSDFTDILGGY